MKTMSFNSIMVQLEQLLVPFRDVSVNFQFHYGSIRTLMIISISTALKKSFNSIMVQLERLYFSVAS